MKEEVNMLHNVIIIGSGPAGYTAALYAARADLKPLLFTGFSNEHLQGGQLMTTTEVENYPGFPEGITGPELMDLFEKQCRRYGTEILEKEVDKVDFSSQPFQIFSGKEVFQAKSVIVATGASAKWLKAEGIEEFKNRGVTACATCDGAMPKYRNQRVAVIGGGDTAMEESIFLSRFASEVHIFNRSPRFRASQIMFEKAKKHEKITVHESVVVQSCYGEEGGAGLKGVKLKHVDTEEIEDFPLEGLFMGIGHKPNTDIFKNQLTLTEAGYIVTEGKSTKTNIEGVFACGDVQDSQYRQAITSAGTGCMAAIDAERWLESKGV
jgi:thioredoxin reductase (NADPH)